MYDYNNSEPVFLGSWEYDNFKECEAVLENVLTNGFDGVYLLCYKQGNNRGYFEAFSTSGHYFSVTFWDRQYYAAEAYKDAIGKCREFADALGFVKRNEEIPVSDIEAT
jgi:hypothetical protein